MAAKVHTITKFRRGRSNDVEGTLEELTKYFGYTLECGNSWNPRINRNPRTITALVNALNKSVAETQGSCFDPDFYELKKA